MKCNNCGYEFGDQLNVCPNCGSPCKKLMPIIKYLPFIVGAAIILIFIIVGLVKGSGGETITKDSNSGSPSLSGLIKTSEGLCYYIDGDVDTTYTGLAENDDGKWYVENGIVKEETALVKILDDNNKEVYIYIDNGKYDTSFTGVMKNGEYGYRYITEGIWNQKITGLVKIADDSSLFPSKYIYVNKGRMKDTYTGLMKNGDYGFRYVVNGVWASEETRLIKMPKTSEFQAEKWIYIESGKFTQKWTGIAENQYGKWYVKNSVLDETKNGEVTFDGKSYTVKSGKATEIMAYKLSDIKSAIEACDNLHYYGTVCDFEWLDKHNVYDDDEISKIIRFREEDTGMFGGYTNYYILCKAKCCKSESDAVKHTAKYFTDDYMGEYQYPSTFGLVESGGNLYYYEPAVGHGFNCYYTNISDKDITRTSTTDIIVRVHDTDELGQPTNDIYKFYFKYSGGKYKINDIKRN